MALKKSLKLRNGAVGEYFTIHQVFMNTFTKHVSIHFALYADQATRLASPGETLKDVIAKVRLDGDMYDKYLSSTALTGTNHFAQFYKAAKAGDGVISDYHKPETPLFGGATDV